MKFRALAACLAMLAASGASAQSQVGQSQTAAQNDSAAANTATSPDVNLTPRRIVFNQNDRGVKEITVFNRTNKTATYTIVLLDRVMTPDGALVGADEAPGAQKERFKSATNWVRYSPRQVTLGPQEAQTIRVMARRPADAPAGEYRTHFSVTAVPPPDAGLDIADAAGTVENKQLSVRMTPVYGIMIPIIVRTGDLPAQASISDVKLVEQKDGKKAIQFEVNRQGGRSLYGGLEAFLVGSGKQKRIAGIKGVGVYGEIDQRKVALPLADAAGVSPGAKVRIVYTDDELKPGTVLAETETALQ